jgi:hypothetical protein
MDHFMVHIFCTFVGVVWLLFDITFFCVVTTLYYLLVPLVVSFRFHAALLRIVLSPFIRVALLSFRFGKAMIHLVLSPFRAIASVTKRHKELVRLYAREQVEQRERDARDGWLNALDRLTMNLQALQAYNAANPPFVDSDTEDEHKEHQPSSDEEEEGGGDPADHLSELSNDDDTDHVGNHGTDPVEVNPTEALPAEASGENVEGGEEEEVADGDDAAELPEDAIGENVEGGEEEEVADRDDAAEAGAAVGPEGEEADGDDGESDDESTWSDFRADFQEYLARNYPNMLQGGNAARRAPTRRTPTGRTPPRGTASRPRVINGCDYIADFSGKKYPLR